MICNMSETEKLRLFRAFDISLKAVNPATGVLWNTPITVNKELGRDPLRAAYAEIEKHNLCVSYVFMNVRDYFDIRKFRRSDEPTTGLVACLWKAEIIVSQAVVEGTVYVCAGEEHMNIFKELYSDRIRNPWIVASITIKRDDSDSHAPLKTNCTDDNLRSVFG